MKAKTGMVCFVKDKRGSVRRRVACVSTTRGNGLLCAAMLALGSGCSGDVSSMSGNDDTEEPVEEVIQHFDPSPSPEAKKGHVMITLKALQLLRDRGMLPPQLDTPEAEALLVYGNNFGDNTGVGWPNVSERGNVPRTPVKNHMSQLIPRDGAAPFALTSDSFKFDVELDWWDDPTVTTTASASLAWYPGAVDPLNDSEGNHVSDSARLIGSTIVDADLALDFIPSAVDCVASLFADPYCHSLEPKPQVKGYGFSLDNLYHYAYGDLRDFGVPYDDKDTALRLYPLLPSHIPGYDEDESHRDLANKLTARMQNQVILEGADFGAQKYGAILYQLSRRFFSNSRQPEPDLAQLIKVGNDVPGWRTGYMRGQGVIDDVYLEYPHTYLGGMPYTCAAPSEAWKQQAITAFANARAAVLELQAFGGGFGSQLFRARADAAVKAAAPYADVCAHGRPTWPAWIKSGFKGADQPPQDDEDLLSLEVARPGRSDRAALIYLGWAVHMIQDSALPHHVSGWTGNEHSAQDALGDLLFYYEDYAGRTVPQKTCVTQALPPGNPKIPPGGVKPPKCTTTYVPHPYAQ
ncbi:MAG TPA: hypothetical protein VFQ61_09165, partial [Polyangiaceae bacterium]|nr:hypothetical protein [Polyangiaceae bacterium]